MRLYHWVPTIVVALSSCSSGGPSPGPQLPTFWTPGRYALEARIRTADGGSEEITGDLSIRPGGSMTLLSSFGSCRAPTPIEQRRDQERRRRTFTCGDAQYVLLPTADRVRGAVRAMVTERFQQRTRCPVGRAPPCYWLATRRVARSADLVVFRVD